MLAGRLGLETARVPHADRHGLLWLQFGQLYVEDGTLRFLAASGSDLKAGDYAIPFQTVSLIVLGPGTSLTHDVLRLCARHGTGLVAVGQDGVRLYTAQPLSPDQSDLARCQVRLWGAPALRVHVARNMYAVRLGELLPSTDIAALRGIEGARMKESYRQIARQFGISWDGRRYDRSNPEAADLPNQAINHAATAVEAAAGVAVAATGTVPALGFIHEDSGLAWVLDVADLSRTEVTLPVAFAAVREHDRDPNTPIERQVRRLAGRTFKDKQLIARMIDTIKTLLDIPQAKAD